MKRFLAASAMVAMVALPSSAFADVSIYYFSGLCNDCSTAAGKQITAKAELTLSNYQLGQQIDSGNFVSFHYDGTNLIPGGFTITAGLILGSINGPLPKAENFSILNFGGYSFQSTDTGSWSVLNTGDTLDIGSGGIYSNSASVVSGVPEPSTWAMMLLGFGGLGFLGYRKTRKGDAMPMMAA